MARQNGAAAERVRRRWIERDFAADHEFAPEALVANVARQPRVSSADDNPLLRGLFVADEDDRQDGYTPRSPGADRERRVVALEALREGRCVTVGDCFHTAMIFQHGYTQSILSSHTS